MFDSLNHPQSEQVLKHRAVIKELDSEESPLFMAGSTEMKRKKKKAQRTVDSVKKISQKYIAIKAFMR